MGPTDSDDRIRPRECNGTQYHDSEAGARGETSEISVELLEHFVADDLLGVVVRLDETHRRQLHDAPTCDTNTNTNTIRSI